MKNINNITNHRRFIIYSKNVVDRILDKLVHQRTLEELEILQRALLKERLVERKRILNDEIQKTYEFMYPNSRYDENDAVVLDEKEISQQDFMTVEEKIEDIISFLNKHKSVVGQKQAVKDFQNGLNLLNKRKKDSIVESKKPLLEDGVFGEITYSCLENVCKNYTVRVIKKKIKNAALNRVIFDTKNNRNYNTEFAIDKINKNLKIK